MRGESSTAVDVSQIQLLQKKNPNTHASKCRTDGKGVEHQTVKPHLAGLLESCLQGRPSGPRAVEVFLTSIPRCQQLCKQPVTMRTQKSCFFPAHVTQQAHFRRLFVLTFSLPALGSLQQPTQCSCPAAAYKEFSLRRLSCSTSVLYGTTDLNKTKIEIQFLLEKNITNSKQV